MARNYNYIYSQLVEDRKDIVGHIAYALYKEDKIAFIGRYKEEHGGEEPTEEDLQPFNVISSTPNSLERYKFIASDTLFEFLMDSLEEMKAEVEEDLNRHHIDMIRQAIEPMKPQSLAKSYIHGIAQSIIGAFMFMVLLCSLLFILKFSDTQYTFTFGGDGTAKIETAKQNTP